MGSSTSRCALSESSKHEPPRHPCDGRSDTLSNPDALDAIHVDGTDQPPEHSVVLDGHINRTKRRTIDTAKYIPVSVFPVAYAVHRFYRRYKPRRLPTVASFTLVELYLATATPLLARCLGMADVLDTVRDRDRCTIMLAGRRLRHQVNLKGSKIKESMRILDAKIAQTPAGQSLQAKLKLIREGDYQSVNLAQKLIWWHRHAWSDRITWNGLALLLLNDYPKPDNTQPPLRTVRLDWDLCVTYLTSTKRLPETRQHSAPSPDSAARLGSLRYVPHNHEPRYPKP
ncbi:hypothetical protein LXA43DRAFT_123525 [Ganoderma leucocontextum]|nr:hypothetical protein LXA43DRAFT_123525 [Ganoderma leucocontextum]